MFSQDLKLEIAEKGQKMLKETNHPKFKKDDIVVKTSKYSNPTNLYTVEGTSLRPSTIGSYPAGTLQYNLVSCNIGEKCHIHCSAFEEEIELA